MKTFIFTVVLTLLFFTQAFALGSEEHCLALNLYHEARGVSQEDQLAVAHTTLNRVASEHFPDTVCGVITQAKRKDGKIVRHKCQFSWYCDGRSDKPKDAEAWERAKRIADLAVRWYDAGEDLSEGATFYHANWTRPYWVDAFERTVQLDGHTFYKQ